MAFTGSRVRIPLPPSLLLIMASGSGSDSDTLFSGDMDPDIAALIGVPDAGGAPDDDSPDFGDLFDDKSIDSDSDGSSGEVDMSVKTFTRPAKTEEESKPLFSDKNYYKTVLLDEGDEVIDRLVPQAAERLHAGGALICEISPMLEQRVRYDVIDALPRVGMQRPAFSLGVLAERQLDAGFGPLK